MEENVESVPEGATETVFGWADAALAGDFPTMWRLMDPDLRLAEAQTWVLANEGHPGLEGEDHDELATELAQLHSAHRLRPIFEEARVATARKSLPTWPRERWSPSSHRRLIGEDLDVVLMLDPEVVGSYTPPGGIVGPSGVKVYVTRFSAAGWHLAGMDYTVAVPGWPPSMATPWA